MMDEIFEMIMNEARSRPGDNLKLNAFCVISDLNDRVFDAFKREKANERIKNDDKGNI